MHDEDSAIGLSVQNPGGETWMCYGDKRALDLANNDNKNRCLKALQIYADEIYSAWKNKTKPEMTNYGAWVHAPTLKSALSTQILAPLVTDGKKRAKVNSRRDWSFKSSWTFSSLEDECKYSSWWKFPITLDGPSGVLNGSDIAVTATSSGNVMNGNVFFQNGQGSIREYIHNDRWSPTSPTTFTAKLFSPLAAIIYDSGKEVCISHYPINHIVPCQKDIYELIRTSWIRVHGISKDQYLEEWCYSSVQKGWRVGDLTKAKFLMAANTRLAVVYWSDNGPNIRVYG